MGTYMEDGWLLGYMHGAWMGAWYIYEGWTGAWVNTWRLDGCLGTYMDDGWKFHLGRLWGGRMVVCLSQCLGLITKPISLLCNLKQVLMLSVAPGNVKNIHNRMIFRNK